tara:strand:+ start:18464 stop:19525 length:1062 start_codon:yes stop_codon:yes gene_type:complete
MKFLKYLFFLLLILFVGVALYFGTQDGDFSITETRVIDAPAEVIFEQVNDFKNWEQWGSWMNDASVKINYPEKTSGEGSFYSWTSDDSGDGAMQTLRAEPDSLLVQKIVFNGSPDDEGSTVTWRFEPQDSGTKTKVSWSMEGSLGLFEKMYFATQDETLEQSVSTMYAESLKNLDSLVRSEMNVYNIEVNGITQYSGGFYLHNTTAAKQTEIGAKTAPMIRQIHNFMEANNIASHGPPFVLYLDWDEMNQTSIFSVGIPTSDRVILPDGSPVASGYMSTTTAIKTTLNGRHTYLSKAWEETEKYIQNNGFVKSEEKSPFEVYVTALPEEKNPAKWVTEIYIPVEVISDENEDL